MCQRVERRTCCVGNALNTLSSNANDTQWRWLRSYCSHQQKDSKPKHRSFTNQIYEKNGQNSEQQQNHNIVSLENARIEKKFAGVRQSVRPAMQAKLKNGRGEQNRPRILRVLVCSIRTNPRNCQRSLREEKRWRSNKTGRGFYKCKEERREAVARSHCSLLVHWFVLFVDHIDWEQPSFDNLDCSFGKARRTELSWEDQISLMEGIAEIINCCGTRVM